MVQRGVEGVLLGGGATPHGDASQEGVPALLGLSADGCTDQPGSSARRFSRASCVLTNEMPTFMSTWCCFVVSNVTKDPQVVPEHVVVPGVMPAAAPRPGRRERPVEQRHEVQRVGGAGAAELPAGHLALHLVVADDPHAGGCRPGCCCPPP